MKDALKATLTNVLESIKDIVTRLSYSDWIALNGQIYYRKKNGFVILKANSGSSVTVSSGTLVGTLPSGYRPDQVLDFAASAMGGDSEILCRVDTDGGIRMWASPSTRYWSFCVTFPLGGVLHSSIFKAFSDFMSLRKGGGVNEVITKGPADEGSDVDDELYRSRAGSGDNNNLKRWSDSIITFHNTKERIFIPWYSRIRLCLWRNPFSFDDTECGRVYFLDDKPNRYIKNFFSNRKSAVRENCIDLTISRRGWAA